MGKIIAVDFDGTICENRYPQIGPVNMDVLRKLIAHRASGGRLILWSCRAGDLLKEAVAFCRSYGLEFDAVNDNLPEIVSAFHGNTRKVYADEYWDDRNRVFSAPTCDNCQLRKSTAKPSRSIYSWCANACKNYRPKG